MANEIDPHHLVALMSFTFNKQDGTSRLLYPTFKPPKYGVPHDHNTGVCAFPALDAIASISVSEAKSQVVAAALQLSFQTQEVRLTVAANQTIGESLVCHLTAMWKKLQALSDVYAEERKARGTELNGGGSPDMPVDVGRSLRREIFRHVYQFSLKKQMKRSNKWMGGFNRLVYQLLQRRGDTELEGLELRIYNVAVGLFLATELLDRLHENPQTQLLDHEWEVVSSQTMFAAENATLALLDRNGFGCEILARELNDYRSEDTFQLRRALEKLTSLARHINSLVALAHSPRLRRVLQCRISVFAVPAQTRTVKLPTSQEQWQSILDAACSGRSDRQWKEAGELLKTFRFEECECPLHCECVLIQHLESKHNDQWDNIHPFSYIGVSKLSCGACCMWVEAFNELGGRKFYTRGWGGKWCWPWGMAMAKESLGKTMTKKVSGKYLAHQALRLDWEITYALGRFGGASGIP